jgi:hypothetical protein
VTDPVNVYIAGPMRGYPEFNFPAFDAAERSLRAWGYSPFSPAAKDREGGFDPTGMTGNEDLSSLGFNLREALGADLEFITTHAEGILLLPGWEESSGVYAELTTAAVLGLVASEATDAVVGYRWAPAADFLAERERRNTPVYNISSSGEVRITNAVTGGQKGSKLARYDLIPVGALKALAEHYGKGAEKYADNQWRLGYDWSLSYAALQRHANAFWDGEDTDEETGSPHMAAVAWHAFALLTFAAEHPELDNRPGA